MTDATETNAHEFTVSELAGSLKRTVEDTFGHVRVRGELGRVTQARSGHVYMDLKDDRAVISSIVWKGVAGKFTFKPEEGLEVIAEGKLTTYPGRSQYQLIISKLEPAGEGALMALLVERRKKLTAEGLFDEARKQALPWLPKTIGVITSPTGAVIRDILHRLDDRFPRQVLLWPVLVQGDRAAPEIAKAIHGFDTMEEGGQTPKPDLLIVARGGGSIEDLWAFNEEEVVRAAANCSIPLISAIGHETDWTLLDLVADKRAPTPTGAAEMAVPVRADLAQLINEHQLRLKSGLRRFLSDQTLRLKAASRGLPKLEDLLGPVSQKFDYVAGRLIQALQANMKNAQHQLMQVAAGLRSKSLIVGLQERQSRSDRLALRLSPAMQRTFDQAAQRLSGQQKLLAALSHKSVLRRGFALVKNQQGKLVRTSAALKHGQAISLEFSDGQKPAIIGDSANAKPSLAPKKQPQKIQKPAKPTEPEQGNLF